ncbi:hypothetical protein EVG20_g1708 [Dentipellis fragilis]|uniref:Uncharacterized protein n=1 Tax=Dentipellis fragilis TaxID=205917 RepID=A0A4Y9ZA15_9AGAM|nr:hypothetical protein EVG20_g1708 [Dentipellis fragilis]
MKVQHPTSLLLCCAAVVPTYLCPPISISAPALNRLYNHRAPHLITRIHPTAPAPTIRTPPPFLLTLSDLSFHGCIPIDRLKPRTWIPDSFLGSVSFRFVYVLFSLGLVFLSVCLSHACIRCTIPATRQLPSAACRLPPTAYHLLYITVPIQYSLPMRMPYGIPGLPLRACSPLCHSRFTLHRRNTRTQRPPPRVRPSRFRSESESDTYTLTI